MERALTPFRVTLNEEPGDKFVMVFDCMAEDADHAAEQAENAYPGCKVLNCTESDQDTTQDDQAFDTFQQIVLSAYNEGDHCVHRITDIPDCGDSLLKFLLSELSEKEDCDSLECAVNRLDSAIRQLTEVQRAFMDRNLA